MLRMVGGALLSVAVLEAEAQGSAQAKAPPAKPAAAAPRFPQPRPPFEAYKGIITSTTPKTKADRVIRTA